MSDLDAIREDVALAARSVEMARHVALDHAPELLDELERLRTELKDRRRTELETQVLGLSHDLEGAQAERDHYLAIIERVQELCDRAESGPNGIWLYTPAVRRALTGQQNMWDGFTDDCECIHCKPMDSEPWHGKASS